MGMCVQPYEGWWMSRSLARDQVHKHMGDTGMMDYMLKAIANRTVGPWAVFRCHCPSLPFLPLVLSFAMPFALPFAIAWSFFLLSFSHCPLLCPSLCPLLCPLLYASDHSPSLHCLSCPLLLFYWPHAPPSLPVMPSSVRLQFPVLQSELLLPFATSFPPHALPISTFLLYAIPCQPHILPSSTFLPFALPLHLFVSLPLPSIVMYRWETKSFWYCPLACICGSGWFADVQTPMTKTKCSSTWLSRRMVPLPCLQLMLYTLTLLRNLCHPLQKLLPSQGS